MNLKEHTERLLPAIEAELQRQVARLDDPQTRAFHEMLAYHMGWTNADGPRTAAGKRIRPLLVLLVASDCGSAWMPALPAAAAVEIIHNFSLVHDDIEDNSETRRGRLTLWKKYGVPMAINAGDAFFSIANQAILDLAPHYAPDRIVRAAGVLHAACLQLTQGQFLDMSFEKRLDVTVAEYWPMIEGKTAALLSAAAQIGAILGGCKEATLQSYAAFARNLGLAFQVRDDILGIWGDEKATGKSVASDLLERKNSLPILFGIAHQGEFARRWAAGPVTLADTSRLANALKDEGAYAYAEGEAQRLTALAMEALEAANPAGGRGSLLAELATALLNRRA